MMKKILNRPSVHLFALCFMFGLAGESTNALADLYREGAPLSWGVVVVHIIAIVLISLFIWLFERLNNRMKWAQKTGETIAKYKAGNAA